MRKISLVKLIQRTCSIEDTYNWPCNQICDHHLITSLPPEVKTLYLHFRYHANYFLLPWYSWKKLADDRCSSITKGSIYHIKHWYIQPFTTAVDCSEIWWLMEVSTMFYNCRMQILHFYLGWQIFCHSFGIVTPCIKSLFVPASAGNGQLQN